MTRRRRRLVVQQFKRIEPLQRERLDQLRRLPGGDQLRVGLAADRGGLETPGAPAGVQVVVRHRAEAHHG